MSYLDGWNEGAAKRAILDYVVGSATEGASAFVPLADRVAAFDNDGTLWVEQPAPAQTGLLLGKLADQVRSDPSLASLEPYRSLVARDPDFLAALARQDPDTVVAFLGAVGRAWEGSTPEEYDAEVRAFLAATRHPTLDRPFTDLVYRPMLELFDLLRDHGWRVFVCSGGGRDFMRVIAEETWGVLKENVIGSAPEFEYRDGRLVRENTLLGNVALGPGKPEHLFARTGRLPRFAAGNGDVDIEMLEVAAFRLVIVHDDAEREFDYTSGAERILERGRTDGWVMASVREDWRTVFGE
ncbi:HAD family hydrolase [Agromyces sp. M3QZ16-3]|uniref:HAD family hydrolase n=1 Tax=Agromyces sp. M3QZ16-3 TaxID=3447585 RepID=UPI003F690185